MIQLEPHPLGVLLPVRVSPAARRNGIGGEHNGQLKVSVMVAPERGKANEAVRELLARQLGVRRSQIELARGETSSEKRFLIHDVSLPELAQRLTQLLGEETSP